MRSLERNVRLIDAFKVNCPGPLIEFRPAFPHFPAAGAANAAGFKLNPAGSLGWATYFGPQFSNETDFMKLQERGYIVEPLAGGFLVLMSGSLTDVQTDFATFSRRRAELKSVFRPDLFEIKYEPGDVWPEEE